MTFYMALYFLVCAIISWVADAPNFDRFRAYAIAGSLMLALTWVLEKLEKIMVNQTYPASDLTVQRITDDSFIMVDSAGRAIEVKRFTANASNGGELGQEFTPEQLAKIVERMSKVSLKDIA